VETTEATVTETFDITGIFRTPRKTATTTDILTITGTVTITSSTAITRLLLQDGDSTTTITINSATNCDAVATRTSNAAATRTSNVAATRTSNAAERLGAAELGSVGIVAAVLLRVAAAL
jgi:hypothetical protein